MAIQKSKENKKLLKISLIFLVFIFSFLMLSISFLSPIVIATPITYNRNPNPLYDYFFDASDAIDKRFAPTNYPAGYSGTEFPVNSTQLSGSVTCPTATGYYRVTAGTTGYLVPSENCYEANVKNYSSNYEDTDPLNYAKYYSNPNPGNNNYNIQVYAIGSGYTIFPYSQYWNTSSSSWVNGVPSNVTITYVEAIIRFVVGNGHVNEGYFSVSYNETVALNDRGNWIMGATFYSPHPNQNTSYWYNSTLVPYRQSQVFTDWGKIQYRWDITTLYNWNVSMLKSNSLYIMWTTQQNASMGKIDYIGLNYKYNTISYNYTTPEILVPTDLGLENRLTAMILLLVLYLPSILLTQYVPKMGFIIGMALMIIILSIIYGTSFLPVMFIGLGSIAIIMYKGA